MVEQMRCLHRSDFFIRSAVWSVLLAIAAADSARAQPTIEIQYDRPPTQSQLTTGPMDREYVEISFPEIDHYNEAFSEYSLRILEQYRKQTKDPKAVQEKGDRFVREAIGLFHSGEAELNLTELAELGQELIAAGSQDPMLHYQLSRVMTALYGDQTGIDLLRKSIVGFQTSSYPTRFVIPAIQRLTVILDTHLSREFEEAADYLADAYVHWLTEDRDFGAEDIRFVANQLDSFFEREGSYDKNNDILVQAETKIAQAVSENEGLVSWLRNMILGHYHITTAWHFRGVGFANTVTEAGWQRFNFHLAYARAHLREAWNETELYPESASNLITIAMAGGDDETVDDWFERSVSAERSWLDAHSKLRYAKLPRWSGSHEEVFEFGEACLERGLWRTGEPMQYIRCVMSVNYEVDENLLANPVLFSKIEACLNGMLRTFADSPDSVRYYRSIYAFLALAGEHYHIAVDQFDKLEGDFSINAYNYAGYSQRAWHTRSRAYVMNSDRGPLASEIEAWWKSKDRGTRKGHDRFGEIIAQVYEEGFDENEKPYWDHFKKIYEMETAYDRGEWVDLEFDLAMRQWSLSDNIYYWIESENSIILSNLGFTFAESHPMYIHSRGIFPGDKEVRCDIEPFDSEFAGMGFGPFAGEKVHPSTDQESDATDGDVEMVDDFGFEEEIKNEKEPEPMEGRLHTYVTEEGSDAYVAVLGEKPKVSNRTLPKPPFHLQSYYFFDGVDFRVNRQRIYSVKDRFKNVPGPYVGLASTAMRKFDLGYSGKVRVSNFRIRKNMAGPPPRDVAERVEYFKAAVENDPEDWVFWSDLAHAYRYSRMYDKSIEAYNISLAGVEDPYVFKGLSDVYRKTGDAQNYIKYFQRFVETHPKFGRSSYQLRMAWFLATASQTGIRDGELALEFVQKAMGNRVPDGESQMTLAAVHAELGEFDKALEEAEKVASVSPDFREMDKVDQMIEKLRANQPWREPVPVETPTEEPSGQ